jgi:L-lactate dehydrogenase complex protein LldG
MRDSSSSREKILASIRSAHHAPGSASEAYSALPRDYTRDGTLDSQSRLDLFVERLRDYDADVRLTNAENLAICIAETLTSRNLHSILIPPDLPSEWLPGSFTFTRDTGLSPQTMDTSDGVLSGCAVAIACTGTLVLQSGPSQGRRVLSLVPDYHLCVVYRSQIVETVPEAFRKLQSREGLPTTFISGPSATADIEMTRIRGVHGPRVLDVIVVT